MGKRKFSVGEFVCAINYEEKCFYYIYDYMVDANYPYCLLSLDGRRYKAIAKYLKSVDSLYIFLNSVLFSLSSRKFNLLDNAKKLQAASPGRYNGSPLNWSLDLRVRRD